MNFTSPISGNGRRQLGSALVLTLALQAAAVLIWPVAAGGETPRMAVATSYLESAVQDVLGDPAPVLRLAEPGTCPGHFDIRPSQAAELRRCQVLLRFDFQSSLDSVLEGTSDPSRVVSISIRRGLCLPDSYLAACRQVSTQLVAAKWLARSQADARLDAIAARLIALSQDATNRVAAAGLRGRPVLASAHQKDFCEWLGLRVVGAFSAADTAGVRQIDDAVKAGRLAGAQVVIANLPEGRRAADALAEVLRAKVAVFGNFPLVKAGRVSFDEMLRENVETLLEAAKP